MQVTQLEPAADTWLLAPSMFGLILAEAFQAGGLPVPKINVGCYSTHQTISLLATDRFVSALSGSQLRFNADRFSIKLLPVDFTTHAWPVAVITLKSRMISPVVQTFMNCVREAAKSMVKIEAAFGKGSTMPSHA